jgi:hypothetical protein
VGFTIIAILSGALILPGICMLTAIFLASWTDELTPEPPPLNSALGITTVGLASIAVHTIWAAALVGNSWVIEKWGPIVAIPPANPYLFLSGDLQKFGDYADIFSLFSGLTAVCIIGVLMGRLGTWYIQQTGQQQLFGGPLTNLFKEAEGPDALVTCYIVSKINHEGVILGYEGKVVTLSRDAERNPISVTMEGVTTFYLKFSKTGMTRTVGSNQMDWLVVNKENWENIAFKVFVIE